MDSKHIIRILTFISFGHQKYEIIKMYDGIFDPALIGGLYDEAATNDDRFIEIFNEHACLIKYEIIC
jgi:hypothetical protein